MESNNPKTGKKTVKPAVKQMGEPKKKMNVKKSGEAKKQLTKNEFHAILDKASQPVKPIEKNEQDR